MEEPHHAATWVISCTIWWPYPYWHPWRVNTDTEQKEHSSQPFAPPPSSVFCFTGAVLAKQQQPGRALRQFSNTLTFSNPSSTAALEVLQTCTCLRGFTQSRPHTRPLHQDSICSQRGLCEASLVLYRQNVSSFGMDTIYDTCGIISVVVQSIKTEIVCIYALIIFLKHDLKVSWSYWQLVKLSSIVFGSGSPFCLVVCVQGSRWRHTQSCQWFHVIPLIDSWWR